MSLKHILNDDPPPHSPGLGPQPPATNGAPTLVVAPQLATPVAPLSPPPQHQREPRPRSSGHDVDPALGAREYTYQHETPSSYQSPASWEHHNGDRLPPDDVPSGPSSSYYAEQEESATPSPRISNGTPVGNPQKEDSAPAESNGRVLRKRKLRDDDEDYHPPGQKRQLRRTPRTRQQHRNATPASESVDEPQAEEPAESGEEDSKPSSDLEDCPELWWSELGNYIIETHKRQKQVDAWFSRWIIERDSITAYRMSHHYRDRLARIPIPPPLPPPPPPVDDELMLKMRSPPSPSSSVYEIGHPDFNHSDGLAFVGEDAGPEIDEPAFSKIDPPHN